MAKNPETVQKFHDDLREKIIFKAKLEIAEINKIKAENMTSDLSNPTLKEWDFIYYYNEYNLRK
jgi:Zn-dependent oligopeptidase